MGDDDRITPHDADQLADCFAAHAREIFGHACALARGDRAIADDLVQAAFQAAGWNESKTLSDWTGRGAMPHNLS